MALIVKERASGVTDSRPKLLRLLRDTRMTRVAVKQQDRLTRFGFHSSDALFSGQGRVSDVVNPAEHDTETFLADGTSRISSFCARLYRQRRAKRNTENIVHAFQGQEDI